MLAAVLAAVVDLATTVAVDHAAVQPPARLLLSRTLGSHMVLQREPEASVVWGYAGTNETITVDFDGTSLAPVKPDANGTWRQILPPTAAGGPYTVKATSSVGVTAELTDVLFGDVFMCGGQSNMQFAMADVFNATAEIAAADHYPHIRIFTVGQATQNRAGQPPLLDLATVQQPWTVANNASVSAGGEFGVFSAVCWLAGKHLSDQLGVAHGGVVPIGLVSNNVGGTRIERWMDPTSLASCETAGSNHTLPPWALNKTVVDSGLYGAMVHPYIVGPMRMAGIFFYQGEQNVAGR
jgi:sialate O-acetylesterase